MDSDDAINPDKAIDYIFKHGKRYAIAKAQRTYMEEYRKSLKAMLMKRSLENNVNAQEREAYSHPEYQKHLEAIREAVEAEEELRWALVAAQARIDVWRSREASARAEVKATI